MKNLDSDELDCHRDSGYLVNQDALIAKVRESLASISISRYFETERGFQGALLTHLAQRIPVLPEGAVIEQEYQKRLAQHGLNIRPDIIIHEPFDPARHATRREGNLAVIELKLNATEPEAVEDIRKLIAMIDALHYPLGLFINIAAIDTYARLVPLEAKGRIVCFAVSLHDGRTHVLDGQA